jgi:hypothetical protein
MQMTYCKAGETPGYRDVGLFDLSTGQQITEVVEANTAEGWAIRLVRDDAGRFIQTGGELKQERVTGRFEFRQVHP